MGRQWVDRFTVCNLLGNQGSVYFLWTHRIQRECNGLSQPCSGFRRADYKAAQKAPILVARAADELILESHPATRSRGQLAEATGGEHTSRC